jgi:hypothetical protein
MIPRTRLGVALLAVLAAACTDTSVARYAGTAMLDSSPDSAAEFELTFIGRDDSSFNGAVRLGPPVNLIGSAYAWHDGAGLRIYVSSQKPADTALLVSKSISEEIGGRFDIIGGPRDGQGGTFHGSLVNGRPATATTLDLPRPRPIPPLWALWPALILIGAFGWAARWIRRVPPFPPDSDGIRQPATGRPRTSLGGWLAFFTLVEALSLLNVYTQVKGMPTQMRDSLAANALVPGYAALMVLELSVRAIQLPIIVTGLVLIFRRSRITPRFWFVVFCWVVTFSAIDLVAGSILNDMLGRAIGGSIETPKESLTLIRQLLMGIVWAAYWRKSDRVRRTFGSAALDTVSLPPSVSPPATAAPRWPRRLAQVGLGTLGVLLVLFAIGVWVELPSRFTVPSERHVRDVIAGRWAWTTDSSLTRCGARAHTIVFSDSGRVMTITTPGSATDTADFVTVYDISKETRSSIRGAIRGEKRLTAGGVPVVWDLILTGPDEYRWRRTDWWPVPWSYTPAITRCDSTTVTPG